MEKTSDLYQHATPLNQRVDAQARFGTRDLTAWFLELVSPRPSDALLDIGCGGGNHLLAFAKSVKLAVGLDTSQALLDSARRSAEAQGLANVRLYNASGDAFDLKDRFDVAMCNFAIYYMDVPAAVACISRHLSSEGRAFVMGSPDENARELMDIHSSVTDFIPDVYAPGYSDIQKYNGVFQRHFKEISFHRFVNPIRFPTVEDFMTYYTATTLSQRASEVEPDLAERIRGVATARHDRAGEVCVTKVVDVAELRGPETS